MRFAHSALENSIHDVDIMLWYAVSPVRRVRGYGRRATGHKNPDTFWCMLEFESGAVGVVETIWMLPEAACVQDDGAPEVITAEEAKRAVRVVLALIESAEKERDIEIGEWD